MKIEQIYTGCLSHAAYYIESNGEAAVFDPLREVQPYLNRAAKDSAVIKYVFETHFHADFVSGHLDLASKTGAQIVYGPTAKPGFEATIADDGQLFRVGAYTIKVLHTPGHTMESVTYLLIDEHGREHGIISGDTLFIGDVGRPDLAQHVVPGLTQEKLARLLYHSLRNKIMPLPDHLIVYPNHGAGSACGKNMSKETTDTLGHQKQVNYALRANMTEDEFVAEVLEGLATPPGYFPKNVLMNIKGYDSLDAVLARAKRPLDPAAFEAEAAAPGVLVLDTRKADEFSSGFIPGSINIGLEGSFASWVGEMVTDITQKILLVTEPGREEEAITRLSRVGYDGTAGYLDGGFEAWSSSGRTVYSQNRMTPQEFAVKCSPSWCVIDVRKRSEYESEHLVGAINIPLNELYRRTGEIPADKPFVLHCAGGYRSMIAASVLRRLGYENFTDVSGGYKDIAAAGVPHTAYTCPKSLL